MKDLKVYNPYNKELIGSVKSFDKNDIMKTINILMDYDFRLSGYDRYKILIKAVELLEKQREKFSNLIVNEIGVSLKDANHEVERTINVLILSAEEAKRIVGGVFPAEVADGFKNKTVYSIREPLGIILCITPFNHPLNQVAHKVCPAIAGNNAVLLKPSYKCPLTANHFVKLLYDAGVPNEMLQIVTGKDRNIGNILVTNNNISMISFTGGVESGNIISNTCGIKKLSLELGGNDALIIDDDAVLEGAVSIAVKGAFGNSGQRCSAVKRIITLPKIHKNFIELFETEVKKLKVGDPADPQTDIGTVIDESAAIEIEMRINDAVEKGAQLIYGGNRRSAQIEPTIIDLVLPDMEIVKKETFGPVAPILRAESFENAIELMNDTTFGLNAGIVTNNLNNVKEFIKKARVGGVRINLPTSYRNEVLPFGGLMDSGYGRGGIISAINEMTNLKTILW